MTYDPDKILEGAFFPVELNTVYMKTGYATDSGLSKVQTFRKLKRFKAIQSQDKPEKVTFAVVSPSYQLVTNEQAYNLGRDLFSKVFAEFREEDLKPMHLIMPKTRSYCHIDLMHQTYKLSFSAGDNWIPFLRITNSYNRSYALGFTMGFCRGICSNGIIFGEKSIKFKYNHSRDAQDAKKDFIFQRNSLVKLEKSFIESLQRLQSIEIPVPLMLPLVYKVFDLKIPVEKSGKKSDNFYAAKNHILELSKGYCKHLGTNGYAALNILTDYASRPDGSTSSPVRTHSFQRKSGEWVRDFLQEFSKSSFSFESYLGDCYKLVGTA
jgi:hypothetical protein